MENKLCSVCKEKLWKVKNGVENAEDNIIVTKCGHTFHNNCLRDSIKSKQCPQCNYPIEEIQLCPGSDIKSTQMEDTIINDLNEGLKQVKIKHSSNMETHKANIQTLAKELVSTEKFSEKSSLIAELKAKPVNAETDDKKSLEDVRNVLEKNELLEKEIKALKQKLISTEQKVVEKFLLIAELKAKLVIAETDKKKSSDLATTMEQEMESLKRKLRETDNVLTKKVGLENVFQNLKLNVTPIAVSNTTNENKPADEEKEIKDLKALCKEKDAKINKLKKDMEDTQKIVGMLRKALVRSIERKKATIQKFAGQKQSVEVSAKDKMIINQSF